MKDKLSWVVFVSVVILFAFFYAVFPLKTVKQPTEDISKKEALAHQFIGAKPSTNQEENPSNLVTRNQQAVSQEQNTVEKPKPIEKPKKRDDKKTEVVVKKTKADKIIAYAKTKLNIPYKQAGTTDKGYDCSGLIMMSYKKLGLSLPRASYQMATKGESVKQANLKKGDLLFFATDSKKPKKICHVGMVTSVENDKVSFIHSTNKRGVIISKLNEKYYKKAYIKAKRFIK